MSTVTRTLKIIVDQSGNALSGLSKIGGALGSIAKVGAGVALGGMAALAAGATAASAAGLSMNNAMEQASARIQAFTKDAGKTAEILDMVQDRAAKTPFAFQAMADATAALLPSSRQARVSLESLIEKAEVLAASNPAEGLEGAAFALKEAVSGDFTSIIERFNLPRQYINQLKEQGVPALEIVSKAMKQLGLDADLVTGLANTLSGRWSTFKDTLQSLVSTVTQPFFDAFSSGLGRINDLLSVNEPKLQQWAQVIADKIRAAMTWIADNGAPIFELVAAGVRNVAHWIITQLIPYFGGIIDKIALLVAAWRSGGFDELFGQFNDGTTFVGQFLHALGLSEETAMSWGRWISDMAMTLRDGFNTAVQWVIDNWPKVVEAWETGKTAVVEFAGAVRANMIAALQDMRKTWDEWYADLDKTVLPSLRDIQESFGRIGDALVDIGKAFTGIGTASKFYDDASKVNLFKLALEGVNVAVNLLAVYVDYLADSFQNAARGIQALRGIFNDLTYALPPWLVPGSPTPLELGLRGITGAAKTTGNAMMGAFPAMGAPAPVAAAGGGGIVIHLTYAPLVSTADQMELERNLRPAVESILRMRPGQ